VIREIIGKVRLRSTGSRTKAWRVLVLSPILCTTVASSLGKQAPVPTKEIKAVRVDEPPKVDGEFDDPVWIGVERARDFIQTEPNTGEPASEPTEVRMVFTEKSLFFAVQCFDSAAPQGLVVTDVKKDFSTRDSDVFEIMLDTFNDDRNGFVFGTNPKGARFDAQIGSEGQNFNRDWDAVWIVEAKITDEGWQLEIEIPFKTLRFIPGEEQTWGLNFLRRIRRKREDSYWSPIPRPFRITRVSLGGTLDGLGGIDQGRNLRFKPYLVAPVGRAEDDDVDFKPDVGLDIKWGVTPGSTLDVTVNTDFSQVEADEEQINLTRFSLFFPEKREFFLESSSIFEVGRIGGGFRSRPYMMPFFSRRIGIEDEELVPILVGGRLTGRAGAYGYGALTMQTAEFGEIPSTNFSVVRLKRNFLRRSEFGGIFVNKQQASGGDYNRTFGLDANLTFLDYLSVNSYLLKSQTPDLKGDDVAGDIRMSWDDGFWEIEGRHLSVQENFNPEVGFVRRENIKRTSGEFGITPRPREMIPAVREFRPSVQAEYLTNQEGELETRAFEGRFTTEFENGTQASIASDSSFERLSEPFEIRDGQFIEAGDYKFKRFSAMFSTDRSRVVSGTARYEGGGFYDGDRKTVGFGFRLQPSYRFRFETDWRRNDIDLPSGDFDTDLVGSRLGYAFSTDMFLNAVIQYNSESKEIISNIRYNFIYKPLSDLFLVYNERRSTTGEVIDRAIILKLTYMLAF
jgi:hypothetical protein